MIDAARMMARMLQRASRPPRICLGCRYGSSSVPGAAPPMLQKLRADMKTALKAKDKDRLNVLRALLADITNSSKTPKPIQTDLQLLSLLRKRAATSRAAAQEFSGAGRDDLRAKEAAQVSILDEYAGSVETVSEEQVRIAVEETIVRMKARGERLDLGAVLNKVLGDGGVLDGKPVEKGQLARAVQYALSGHGQVA